ncbi:S41 family peptidase [Parabacteroides sp. FAFU027]|uniref:S41 family peptidase n=1 Tax=Parabacteroides sp. FAFU027 TaxID=2922715 RepID=UPI001FAEBDB1|nr:S41 family peptidase [Parabacteroides sp. FAFU027]
MKRFRLGRNAVIAATLLLSNIAVSGYCDEKHNFDNTKNLDVFYSIYKQLDLFYVDSIKPEKVIRTGINAMLGSLDPYTNYIPEDEMEDFKFITTGEYGGIGSIIGSRNGNIIISEPYENMPAAKAGLKAGDVVLEIDGKSVKGKAINEVSEWLKGQPNTIIKIKYQRDENKPKEVTVTRSKITVSSVPYYTVVGNNTGYILISSFTDKTGEEFKSAFLDLKNNKKITSLIIDLRGNGGGIMEEAIKVINYFVPKGVEVVSTKGKVKQWDRVYKTPAEPLDTQIPIAVMVNRGSASASEIVSGALQDLDRAVIIGSRTFGKGLVQTTRPISYNGSIKVTTAKYYTPSGRCVQAIDYSNRNPDGSVGKTPDSLTTVFYTKNRRPVRDGGGITPDVTTEEVQIPNIVYYLESDYLLFDYATQYVRKHDKIDIAGKFALTDADFNDFKAFVKSKNFTYDRQSDKALKELKEVAKFEGYYESAEPEFKALEAKLTHDLDKSLNKFSTDIRNMLEIEIAKRYYFQKGEIAQTLKNDKEIKKTLEVINNAQKTSELLKATASK